MLTRGCNLLVLLLVHLSLQINFPSLNIVSLNVLFSRFGLGYSGYVCISTIWWKFLKYSSRLCLCCRKRVLWPIWSYLLWERSLLLVTDTYNLPKYVVSFKAVCWISIILHNYLVPLTFPFQPCSNCGHCLHCSRVQFLYSFLFPIWLLILDIPNEWTFYFQGAR